MITAQGWLPRNTVVDLSLTDRGARRPDGKRYWEVLVWRDNVTPVKVGGWGFAEFPFTRVSRGSA